MTFAQRYNSPTWCRAEDKMICTYVEYDTFVDETLLFGSHDEIVSLVFVVHDVLQVDTGRVPQIVKEFLVEDERHTAYLFDACLLQRVLVNEICGNGDGQFPSELLLLEA